MNPPTCPSWPTNFTPAIGSRWKTRETLGFQLQGTLIAADRTENSVSLQLEETKHFSGGLANQMAWNSTAQTLLENWEPCNSASPQ